MARAHWLGGRGAIPRQWLLDKERLWGMVAPIGACPLARGTGSPAPFVAASYRVRAGDGGPQWHEPTGWGDKESCPIRGRFLWSAYEGMATQKRARKHMLEGRGVLFSWWSLPMQRLQGDGSPQWRRPSAQGDGESCSIVGRFLWSTYPGWQPPTPRAKWLGGRGTLPTRWSLPTERLQGMATPNGECPVAGIKRNPTQWVFAAYGARIENGIPQCHGPSC